MGTTGAFWIGGKKTYRVFGARCDGGAGPGRRWGGHCWVVMARGVWCVEAQRAWPSSPCKEKNTSLASAVLVLFWSLLLPLIPSFPTLLEIIEKKIALLVLITCRGTFGHEWAVHSSWKLRKWQNQTTSLLALLLICMGAFINVDNCRKSEFIHSGSASGQV